MHVVKSKVLISCVVTTQLICAFFTYAKSRFSHDMAQVASTISSVTLHHRLDSRNGFRNS